MNLFKLFYDSIFNFSKTLRAYYMKWWEAILYLLLLGLVGVIPFLSPTFKMLDTVRTNGDVIVSSIPDYSIQDGQMVSEDQQAFINQTDYVTYAYDPTDSIEENDFLNIRPNTLHIESGKEQLSITLGGQTETLDYDNPEYQINSAALKGMIERFTHVSKGVVGLAVYIWRVMECLIVAVIIAVFMSFSQFSRNLKLRFSQRFNFTLTCMTLSEVLIAIIALFFLSVELFYFWITVIISSIRIHYLSTHTHVIPIDPKAWQGKKDKKEIDLSQESLPPVKKDEKDEKDEEKDREDKEDKTEDKDNENS